MENSNEGGQGAVYPPVPVCVCVCEQIYLRSDSLCCAQELNLAWKPEAVPPPSAPSLGAGAAPLWAQSRPGSLPQHLGAASC